MRRENRTNRSDKTKNILYIAGSILGLGVIAFTITFVLYGNKMDAQQSKLNTDKIAEFVQNNTNSVNTQSASTQIGKTVEESQNEINNTSATNTVNNTNKANKTEKTQKTQTNQTETKTEKKEITFTKPVEGEISRDYAKENLIFSETLQEWTTHLGIDIKAEKTSVVKACADGKIKSIKNDPRYGLSVIIEHQDGFETLYANLLTSEFVEVGEEVKQGDSIGTVGNTAAFEIADTAHLHFEIRKNGENVDPNQYVK